MAFNGRGFSWAGGAWCNCSRGESPFKALSLVEIAETVFEVACPASG